MRHVAGKVALGLAVLVLVICPGCGGGDGSGGTTLLAKWELDTTGGNIGNYTHLPIVFGAQTHSNPMTDSVQAFAFAPLGNQDDGVTAPAAETAVYQQSVAALTDGAVSRIGIGVIDVGNSANEDSMGATSLEFLAPGSGAPDLAGWVIDRIVFECDSIDFSIASGFTSYDVVGRVLVFGHRP